MLRVFKLESKKWGIAPQWLIAFAVPTNVKAGSKTSSSFFTPKTFKATWRAIVPFRTAIAYLAPVNF